MWDGHAHTSLDTVQGVHSLHKNPHPLSPAPFLQWDSVISEVAQFISDTSKMRPKCPNTFNFSILPANLRGQMEYSTTSEQVESEMQVQRASRAKIHSFQRTREYSSLLSGFWSPCVSGAG